ncbi:formyltransferase family protein [Candidatus Spongiihabitans sp.]|uniref:formyltransferase family protein n=1 Tax=Candidatus Spongiihabitans sp. TaxID=3101308 RepID=UPI003C6EC9A8
MHNERYSGVTVHRMSEQMDTGEVVIQRSISISPDETAWSLKYKHLDLYPDLLLNAINLIGIGNMNFTQYDSSAYHRFHALNHSDYQYDFSQDQFYLKRFIRATTDDKPKGYIIVKNTTFYPMSIELPEVNFRGIPGRVIGRIEGAIGVATNTDESGRSGVLVDKCYDVNGNIVAAASILETGNQL